jgi:hypothetical protein
MRPAAAYGKRYESVTCGACPSASPARPGTLTAQSIRLRHKRGAARTNGHAARPNPRQHPMPSLGQKNAPTAEFSGTARHETDSLPAPTSCLAKPTTKTASLLPDRFACFWLLPQSRCQNLVAHPPRRTTFLAKHLLQPSGCTHQSACAA